MYIYEISDHSTCNKIANLCNKSGIKYKSCLSYYCQFPINNFILIYTKPNNNKSITHKHNNLQSLSFSLAIYRPMHVWLLDLSKIAVCAIQCHQNFFSLFNARGHLNLNIFKHCILNTHVYTFDWFGGGASCVKVKLNKNPKRIWTHDLLFTSTVLKPLSNDDAQPNQLIQRIKQITNHHLVT